MINTSQQPANILEFLKGMDVDTIVMGIPDIDGVFRGKFVPVDYFAESISKKGSYICNILFGWDIQDEILTSNGFSGWKTGFPDIIMMPDTGTLRKIPWSDQSASAICDVLMPDGSPVEIAPRTVLKRQIERAARIGYRFSVGYELEFYIFTENTSTLREKNFNNLKPLTPSSSTYSLHRAPIVDEVLSEIRREMIKYGIPVEAVNTEYGAGQFEISIKHSSSLEAADMTLLYKAGVKEIVARHGLTASFMAKVDSGLSGSSGHIHQSITPIDQPSRNLFWNGGVKAMSDLMKQAIAGQMAAMSELTAFYCPTINSYKRLVPGSWAPMSISWGYDNRTTGLRAIANGEKSIRIENRLPGADANPYLSIAACMAGSLYGIENQLELSPMTKGNAYNLNDLPKLPNTLEKAVEMMENGSMAREAFGAEFVDHYLMTRRWELDKYRTAVTEWDRRRYLEKI